MKFKLFFTIMTLTTIHQSFSMIPDEQLNLNNRLLEAAKVGNNDAVTSLLQAGADINAKEDVYGDTPLHLAAEYGNTVMVELLLSHGADINAKADWGITPLHRAAEHGHTATVVLLLAHGAHINAKDNIYGYTPLHYAAKYAASSGKTATVELLLSHGADINAKDNRGLTALHWAGYGRNSATLKLLLKDYPGLLEQAQKPTKALLKVAIERGCYNLMNLLLKRGIKPDVSDLQLAKEKWQTAEDKQSYEAIGQLLIKKLNLLPKVEGIPAGGSISKAGIVGLYGLTEDIAQEIAKHL